MEDGLAGAGAVVEYGAVAREQVALGGQFGSYQLQFAEQRLVACLGVVQRDKMFPGAIRMCVGACGLMSSKANTSSSS